MKIILDAHRAVLVLTAAGGYALTLFLLKPYSEGIPVGWLVALGVVLTVVTVLVMAIFSAAIAPPTTHQALGGLLILTGLMLVTL